jgi:hypothetical protein
MAVLDQDYKLSIFSMVHPTLRTHTYKVKIAVSVLTLGCNVVLFLLHDGNENASHFAGLEESFTSALIVTHSIFILGHNKRNLPPLHLLSNFLTWPIEYGTKYC